NKKRGKILKVEENLFCEGCKNRYDYYEIEKSDGTIQEIKSGCDCEAKQMAEQKVKEYKAKIKRSEIDRMFNKSKVNDDLQSATFDNYIPRNESQQKAKDTMQRYAKNFNLDNKQSIMLRGSFGLGKSALAMATIKEIKEKGYTVLFY
ncbi:DNA replication protein DnaC, partial [Staphylococcus hominis]